MRSNVLVIFISLFILSAPAGIGQQLRLGDNPAGVEKSAVLDLVSTNQGLLLPRITDTSLINALNPPNGMVIYYVPSNKILIRSGFAWQEVVSANNMSFSTLADAQISLPANGQILTYNGGKWINTTAPFLTSIDTTDIANFSKKVIGIFSGAAPISIQPNGQIQIAQAGPTSDGYLSSSDWNTFNNKQPAGNYITALTGDITASGPGSAAATIAANAVTYSKMQNVSASNKVLGRVSDGAGVIEEISTTGTGDVVRSNSPTLISPVGLVKADVGLGNVDNTSDLSKPISTATQTALNLKINLSEKGANNGVATLDAGGKVPISQMAVGAQVYKGVWSAATNTPFLTDAVGSAGDTYRVIEGGTVNLGSGPITFSASDDIIHNGSIWQRNPATSAVTSVNSQSGTVLLTTDHIPEGYTNKYYTDALASLKINVSEKGANNGVATLDAGGKIPVSQLPAGAQVYKGTWDASVNSPALADGTGTAGWTYRVTVGGTQNLGSGAITFSAGDDIIYNGSVWQRNPNSSAVASVNSQTGAVVLTTDHISEGTTNKYYTNALARNAVSASAPLSYNATTGNFTISQASSAANGFLSSADWTNFNSKQPAGNYITALTGDITASGPGSATATIAPNAVTYDKMQTMTSNKLLGSGATGNTVTEIALGSGLSFSGNTLNVTESGGTVSSFSSGNLSPLFSTTVTNATTTPALSFSLNTQSQNLVFASPLSSSGVPLFRSLAKADLPSSVVYNDQSNTYTSGSKQIFSASSLQADIRLSGYTSDPSTLSNGDVWYNSTSHLFKYRANGTTRIFANTDEAQTFTNKTISGATNTITNIPNSSLVNSTIALTLGTSGTDANVSGTPASLGGSLTLNLPTASSTTRGLLSAADWVAFNSKGAGTVTSVGLSLPSLFTVSGTPVTSSGTLTASLASQSANTVFAGPSTAAGTPTFRSLVASDIPNLDWSKITSGKPTSLTGYGITDAFAQGGNTFATTATLGTNDNNDLVLETNNSEKMRITSAGDVGIATSSPAATLDVNGDFKLGSGGSVLNKIIKTSVTVTDNTNFDYTTSRTETVTVSGATTNATVIVNPRTALPSRLGIGYSYVSAANTVKINITNSGANQNLGTVTFDITIIQ